MGKDRLDPEPASPRASTRDRACSGSWASAASRTEIWSPGVVGAGLARTQHAGQRFTGGMLGVVNEPLPEHPALADEAQTIHEARPARDPLPRGSGRATEVSTGRLPQLDGVPFGIMQVREATVRIMLGVDIDGDLRVA